MAKITEAQAKAAYLEHGTYTAAARALGVDEKTVRRWVRKPKVPQGPQSAPYVLPEGHELKARSTYTRAGQELAAWDKTRTVAAEEPAHEPVPEMFNVDRVATYTDEHGNVRQQWVTANRDRQKAWEAFWTAATERAKAIPTLPPLADPPRFADDALLAVYPLGDPHIGMLAWAPETGENHDLKIAERDLTTCVDLLASAAPPAETAILANMGDYFHAQGNDRRTPKSGHLLDVDGRQGKVLEIGLKLLERLVLRLLQKHGTVLVKTVGGNHDPGLNDMIGIYLEAVFRAEPRVRIEPFRNPYQYYEHGNVLLGFAHGDGCKSEKLPAIMAAEQKEAWGRTVFRHWLQGHVHHSSVKEHPGCIVETVRTLAGKDFWTHHSGYRSKRSLDVITFHRQYGRIGRVTVPLEMVRDVAQERLVQ